MDKIRRSGGGRGVRLGRLRNEGGQELIEFALASTIFFMMIFGTLQFGLAVWRYNLVSNLAQEGARWASVRGAASTGAMNAAGTEAGVEAYVQSRALGLTVSVTTNADPHDLVAGDLVSVNVQTSFAPLTGIVPMSTLTLQSTAQMIMAR